MQCRSRKPILSVVVVSGLVALVVAGILFRRPLLEHWYLQELESGSGQERKTAAERLGAMQSLKAVPLLVRILQETEQTADQRPHIPIILCRLPGPSTLQSIAPSTPHLAKLYLLEMTDQAWEELWPAKAIAAIGCEGVPRVADAIKDEAWLYGGQSLMDTGLRRAIEAMGEGAVPHLIKMTKDGNPNTRRLAILTLRKLDRDSYRLTQVLVDTLKDEHHGVRLLSAWILGEVGPRAKNAIPDLMDASHDDHEWVRILAQEAINKIRDSDGRG